MEDTQLGSAEETCVDTHRERMDQIMWGRTPTEEERRIYNLAILQAADDFYYYLDNVGR